MSESHERCYATTQGESQTLPNFINLENHTVISNPYQRTGKGGRPALIIDNRKFQVQDLTNKEITIPWGVEMVWAVITPLTITSDSTIQKIVLGSLYSKPNGKKKDSTFRSYF